MTRKRPKKRRFVVEVREDCDGHETVSEHKVVADNEDEALSKVDDAMKAFASPWFHSRVTFLRIVGEEGAGKK